MNKDKQQATKHARRWDDQITWRSGATIAALIFVVSGWGFMYFVCVIASRIS